MKIMLQTLAKEGGLKMKTVGLGIVVGCVLSTVVVPICHKYQHAGRDLFGANIHFFIFKFRYFQLTVSNLQPAL